MSSLGPVDIDRYLARLGLPAPPRPDARSLRALQAAHLRSVPFENASVLRGEAIQLHPALLVDRIARAGRGGFCYQLNGAFAALLAALGYPVAHLPARFHGDRLEPRFGHLALRVIADDEPWLVDVGAGYSFREPLRLIDGLEQDDPGGRFRIVVAQPAPDDGPNVRDVEWRHRDGVFRPHYRFEAGAAPLRAFQATCDWTRTSRDSPFTGDWIATVTTPRGWATLDGRRLRVTGTDDQNTDTTLDDDPAFETALERWFGIRPVGIGA